MTSTGSSLRLTRTGVERWTLTVKDSHESYRIAKLLTQANCHVTIFCRVHGDDDRGVGEAATSLYLMLYLISLGRNFQEIFAKIL
jgi:hypothetical protein